MQTVTITRELFKTNVSNFSEAPEVLWAQAGDVVTVISFGAITGTLCENKDGSRLCLAADEFVVNEPVSEVAELEDEDDFF
jgi:hypothetical protein